MKIGNILLYIELRNKREFSLRTTDAVGDQIEFNLDLRIHKSSSLEIGRMIHTNIYSPLCNSFRFYESDRLLEVLYPE